MRLQKKDGTVFGVHGSPFMWGTFIPCSTPVYPGAFATSLLPECKNLDANHFF